MGGVARTGLPVRSFTKEWAFLEPGWYVGWSLGEQNSARGPS